MLNLSVNRRRGVEMNRGLYRRRNDSQTWHFCPKCSMWPKEKYTQTKPGDEAPTELCDECVSREATGKPGKCN